MKVLKKIKLNHYADEQLKEREMNLLRGGGDDDDKVCVCNNKEGNGVSAQESYKNGYNTSTETCWNEFGYTAHKEFWD